MATIEIHLQLEAASLHGSDAGPQFKRLSATNYGSHFALAFDAAAVEMCWWRFLAVGYGSGNLSLDLYWTADTATSGDVVWGAQIAATTPESDSESVFTATPGSEVTQADTHLGTTANRVMKTTLTISSLDSLAAGDVVTLRLRRVATDSGDTMAGDAWLVQASLRYSDS